MDIHVNEIKRITSLLQEPSKVGANDLPLLEKLQDIAPYFSATHLLKNALLKDKLNATKASLYSNGKLSKHFFLLEINKEDPAHSIEEDPIYEEIEEIDTQQFIMSNVHELDEIRRPQIIEEISSTEIILESDVPIEEVATFTATNTDFPEIETVIPDEPEHAPVSKYDDDQLPYTFLWWLAKTRAQHKAIFQPYAAPKKQEPGALQQQYVEHIFHLQTGVGIDDSSTNISLNNNTPGKDSKIIEAFLESDPQIRPPQHNKIDNENKARKSAEDHNDVVSETLANIYIEQMLYHKAIETYEKLSLKFPEKSRYFADLIKSLEKKI